MVSLWSHPLEEISDKIGFFEKSISYTNWMACSKSPKFTADCDYLIQEREYFIETIKELQPRLIFFFGKILIETISNEKISKEIENILGTKKDNAQEYPERKYNYKKFIVRFITYEKCDIVCFPHPTGSRGLSDKYIELFKDEVNELIKKFKA